MLEINRRNILGWLRLIRDVVDLDDVSYKKLDYYIKKRNVYHRDKLLDELYGEEGS